MRLRAYLIFKPTFKYLPDETLSILVFEYIVNIKSFKVALGGNTNVYCFTSSESLTTTQL